MAIIAEGLAYGVITAADEPQDGMICREMAVLADAGRQLLIAPAGFGTSLQDLGLLGLKALVGIHAHGRKFA